MFLLKERCYSVLLYFILYWLIYNWSYNNYIYSVIGIESWAETSNNTVKKSQIERAKSHQLRNDINNVINAVGYKTCEAWAETNKAFDRRIAEMLEAKEKLQTHLHKATNIFVYIK